MQVLLTTRSVNVLTGLRNPAQRLTGRRRIRFGPQITGTTIPPSLLSWSMIGSRCIWLSTVFRKTCSHSSSSKQYFTSESVTSRTRMVGFCLRLLRECNIAVGDHPYQPI